MFRHFFTLGYLIRFGLLLGAIGLSHQLVLAQINAQVSSESGLAEQTQWQQLQQQVQQSKTITLHLQHISLDKALLAIAKQAAVGIFYNPAQLPDRVINLQLKNVPLLEALGRVLLGTQLEAVWQDGDVIVKPKPEKPGALGKSVRTITGKVTQARSNEPLPGVNVSVRATTTGTLTNAQGEFFLTIPEGEVTLVFSHIGMATQEIAVISQTVLNIVLQPVVQSLDEVVVVGYGTQQRSDITGAAASLSERDIRAVPVVGLDQSLEGRLAGVQVTQASGQPGGSVNIRIRGWSSISAGNEPLYVIDGVPFYNWGTTLNNGPAGIFGTGVVHNALSVINPNDIESITVLKDAAAAAIYGSRAANGVVLITTKRGKTGKARIELDSYYGLQQVAKKFELLNARQYAELINESRANARSVLGISDPAGGSAGVRQIPALENPAILGSGTNWQDQIFRQAPIQNHQLTISGGNESTRYALSGGYYNQEGIIKVSGYQRYSFRLNLDQQVSGRFKVGASFTLSNATNLINRATGEQRDGGLIFGALLQTPLLPVYTVNGEYARPDYQYFDLIDNPLSSALDYQHTINTTRMIGNVYGELTLAEGLLFRTGVALDANYLKNNIFIPTRTGTPPPSAGAGFAFASQEVIWLNENAFSYHRLFDNRHDLSAVVGATLQGSHFERMISRVFNFPNDLVTTTNGGQTNLTNSFAEDWRLVSFLGRINYALSGKYLLSLAARTDGSSRFGPGRRFGFFPAVSAGWRLSQENFLKGARFLSDLKLRASYGLTGNSEILNTVNSFANYAYLGSVGTANYAFGGAAANGLAPTSLTNDNLGWESTTQWDFGLDVGLFNNRISLVLDWYRKTTNDLLVGNTPLPYTTGFASAVLNVGSIRNQGWEVTLNTLNLAGAFTWNTSFNIARNRNTVIGLGRNVKEIALGNTLIRPGEPVSSFYGHQVESIFQSSDEVLNAPKQEKNTGPGDLRFRDINGDRLIDNADRTILGNPLPDYVFGMTNTFAFKGIELSVFLNGVAGNEIVNFTRSRAENMGGQHNQSINTLNRWRSPTQPGDGKTPRAVAVDFNQNNRFSNRWVEDGSYLRVRTLTLGYNFPQALRLGLSNLKLYVTVQNALTLTRYQGYDPEVGNSGNSPLQQGYDSSNYPLPRTVLFGMNIQL